MFMFVQRYREKYAECAVVKEVFNPVECQALIALAKARPSSSASVGDGIGQEKAINQALRRTDIYWLDWATEVDWAFKKLAATVERANELFGFGLSGMQEGLQVACYRSEVQGHYGWHEDYDNLPGFAHRKLSVSVALNDQMIDYEGGDFEFLHSGKVEELASVGSVLVFPSFKTHRVTPVTAGERWSLVAWISGPPFR